MSQIAPMFMDCIVVGGTADGLYLRRIRASATFVKLGRPDFIKPLESPKQAQPEVVKEESVYEVHPISLQNTHEKDIQHVFGIAVVEGKSLTWAFQQLVQSHAQMTVLKLQQEQPTIPH